MTPSGAGTYSVVVSTPAGATTHTVTVPTGLRDELGFGDATEPELVRESFVFLLEREPNTSILRSFSLDVISRYFPDYPNTIRRA